MQCSCNSAPFSEASLCTSETNKDELLPWQDALGTQHLHPPGSPLTISLIFEGSALMLLS